MLLYPKDIKEKLEFTKVLDFVRKECLSLMGKTYFDQIQVIDNQKVIFSKEGKLFLQDAKIKAIYPIENVDKSFEKFYYKDQILSIFTNKEITNYKIKIP